MPRRLQLALSLAALERATELLEQLVADDPSPDPEEAWDRAVRQAHGEDLAGALPPSQRDWRRLAWLAMGSRVA